MSAKIVIKGYDASGKVYEHRTTSDKPETLERLLMDFCGPRRKEDKDKRKDD